MSSKKTQTTINVSIPPSENIQIMNAAKIAAPGGLDMSLKLPFTLPEAGFGKVVQAIENIGGKIEITNK